MTPNKTNSGVQEGGVMNGDQWSTYDKNIALSAEGSTQIPNKAKPKLFFHRFESRHALKQFLLLVAANQNEPVPGNNFLKNDYKIKLVPPPLF